MDLCNTYQHIRGTAFAGPPRGIVECVAVAPFDNINKFIFLEFYKESGDPMKALEFYKFPYYDVIFIIRSSVTGELFFGNLESSLSCLAG